MDERYVYDFANRNEVIFTTVAETLDKAVEAFRKEKITNLPETQRLVVQNEFLRQATISIQRVTGFKTPSWGVTWKRLPEEGKEFVEVPPKSKVRWC